MLSDTNVLGEAVTLDFDELGEPATKVIVVVREAGLAVAVIVFASALVATNVVVATPLADVAVAGDPTVSLALLLAKVTFWFGTTLANLSRTVKVTVEMPATVWLLGEAASVDSVAFGVPAVVVTEVTTLPLPMLAITVRVCATELRSVVATLPFASVLPLVAPNVSLLPALAKVTACEPTAFRYWS